MRSHNLYYFIFLILFTASGSSNPLIIRSDAFELIYNHKSQKWWLHAVSDYAPNALTEDQLSIEDGASNRSGNDSSSNDLNALHTFLITHSGFEITMREASEESRPVTFRTAAGISITLNIPTGEGLAQEGSENSVYNQLFQYHPLPLHILTRHFLSLLQSHIDGTENLPQSTSNPVNQSPNFYYHLVPQKQNGNILELNYNYASASTTSADTANTPELPSPSIPNVIDIQLFGCHLL